jgi:metal-responsive CopG/Arc/MetJ family transcriptional regulator
MKTAISIPDELFHRGDDLARQSGKSRSQLYRDALAEYLDRHDPQAVTLALDALVDELGSEPDAWLDEAACRTVQRSEW